VRQQYVSVVCVIFAKLLKPVLMQERLVISVANHTYWGYILQPLIVREEDDSFVILEVANRNSVIYSSLSNNQKDIVKSSEKYSDKNLMKFYSREKKIIDFYKKVSQETVDKHIRPLIDRNQKRIIDFVIDTQTPLYFRKALNIRILYEHDRIEVSNTQSSVIFNFIKEKDVGIRYFIQVKNSGNVISLLKKDYSVISYEPAIILIGNKLFTFDDIDFKKLIPFFEKEYITVPQRSEKNYLEKFVKNCLLNYEVNIEGIDFKESEPQKKAVLTFENGIEGLPVFILKFVYNGKTLKHEYKSSKVVKINYINENASIDLFNRDREWEKKLSQLLVSNGLTKNGSLFVLSKESDTYSYIDWFKTHKEVLSDFEFIQLYNNISYYLGEIKLDTEINEKRDWFDIRIIVIIGKFEIPFIYFRKHILNNIREYILPDQTVAILPEEWFDKYEELMFFGKASADSILIKKQLYNLLPQLETGISISDRITKEQSEIIEPPAGLNATLRSYQQKGYSWMVNLYESGFGGCLADDMGLGKTVQTISLLQFIANKKKLQKKRSSRKSSQNTNLLFSEEEMLGIKEEIHPSLIVVPTSLLYNWQNELHRFAPKLKVCAFSGSKRKRYKYQNIYFSRFDVIITTYGTLRIDIDMFGSCKFHHLILDESQYVKNPDSLTFKAIKQIDSLHKLTLTGTPVENSLVDLWAQFDIINEGVLGSYTSFRNAYLKPILRNSKEKSIALINLVKPFVLRRTKSEVAPELPSLTEEVIFCEMSDEQKDYYNKEKSKIRTNILEGFDSIDKSKFAIVTLQGLMRLRQLANHPVIQDEEYKGDSGKFELVAMTLESIIKSNHKVLVYSSFVKHLCLFSKYFEEREWKYSWLTGASSPEEREKEINRFMNDDETKCFFISLKAGGVGLNLTAAEYVIILDPWWNPAAEMQAISRSHRIGQSNNVIAYRFITIGTIEEKIMRLQESKTKLAQTFVMASNPLSALSNDELYELLD
jgi:superfamily II DNA or RNA helicase